MKKNSNILFTRKRKNLKDINYFAFRPNENQRKSSSFKSFKEIYKQNIYTIGFFLMMSIFCVCAHRGVQH